MVESSPCRESLAQLRIETEGSVVDGYEVGQAREGGDYLGEFVGAFNVFGPVSVAGDCQEDGGFDLDRKSVV